MPVYLDDAEVDAPAAGGDLGSLLDATRDRLASAGGPGGGGGSGGASGGGSGGGRVVVEVHVDGEALSDAEIAARRGEPLGDAEVRLVTADLNALVVDTLDQVRVRLEEAETLQADAADLLQRDDTPPAFAKIGESVAAWLQVQQAVLQASALMRIDLDTVTVDGEPAHALTTEALERLQGVKAALQAGDTIALADTLAYEWPDLTARWDRFLAVLIERVEG